MAFQVMKNIQQPKGAKITNNKVIQKPLKHIALEKESFDALISSLIVVEFKSAYEIPCGESLPNTLNLRLVLQSIGLFMKNLRSHIRISPCIIEIPLHTAHFF